MTILTVCLFIVCFIHNYILWKQELKSKPTQDDKRSFLLIAIMFQVFCFYLCCLGFSIDREIAREKKFISYLQTKTHCKVTIEHKLCENNTPCWLAGDTMTFASLEFTFFADTANYNPDLFCNTGKEILKEYQQTVWLNDTTRRVCPIIKVAKPTNREPKAEDIFFACNYSPNTFKCK